MKSNPVQTRLAAALFAAIIALPAIAQTNGVWITAGGGTYSTTTNWLDNTVAGSGGSANFNNVNIPAGASTVTLDVATSLNALTFGDTDTSSAGTWALGGTGGLTLSGTTPTITTNVNTSINSGFVITGSNGYVKEGAGQLTFNTAAATNTITGNISLNAGTLAIRGSSTLGSGQIAMANGTTFRLENNGGTGSFASNAIAVANGATVNFSSSSAGNGYSGLVTGNATSQINIVNTSGQAFALGSSGTAQLDQFFGLVNVAAGNQLRFGATAGANGNGSANATFNIDGTVFTRNAGGAGGVVLGALTGAGQLQGQTNTSAGDVAYVIGGKGIDTSFSGSIVNGSQGTASIRKVGVGTQSFTGSMASNGTIAINGGTARFSGGFNKTGTGAINVNANGTLAGSNATLTGVATVLANGTLRTNLAPSNATDRLTFATSLTLAADSDTIFDIDGVNYTGVTVSTAESLTFGGDLAFNFVNGVTVGTYDLFAFTDSNTGSFANVSVTSFGGLSFGGGLWTGTYGGNTFEFSELTGDLIVGVAIPEPSAFAAIAGVFGLGCAALRRRRSA